MGLWVHEALDRIGGVVGPLFLSAILFFRHSYALGFGLLLVPALGALVVLFSSRFLYPKPESLEIVRPSLQPKGLNKIYWRYVTASCLIAAGFIDYPLIAYHFEIKQLASPAWIPLIYAIAIGAEGASSLFLGKGYDHYGIAVLLISTVLSAGIAPLVFLGGFQWAIVGMVLWGIGMGGQQSVMRAVIASMVSPEREGDGLWCVSSLVWGQLVCRQLSHGLSVRHFLAIPDSFFCRNADCSSSAALADKVRQGTIV